ncbi:uncharacterized protein LOC132169743 [Corylus avellana]|uniref:uncharacterized protein LOC132169743 n=1 Tax=Corylus avellana TaxID=13451 RepID=UPI00286A62CE|nr:uncharacterized protein LOC132169743 [Corylus avellana]
MQRSVEEYRQANVRAPAMDEESSRAPIEKWKAPPDGWCKVNWDVGFAKSSDIMGLGIIVRDSRSNVLATRSLTRKVLLEPIMGEVLASYYAALLCKELALTYVILEGDAKQVVDAIVSKGNCWSRFGHLVEDTRTVLLAFTEWKCVHINRTANNVVHKLAKMATSDIIDRTWTLCIPDCIRDVILMKQLVPSSD